MVLSIKAMFMSINLMGWENLGCLKDRSSSVSFATASHMGKVYNMMVMEILFDRVNGKGENILDELLLIFDSV